MTFTRQEKGCVTARARVCVCVSVQQCGAFACVVGSKNTALEYFPCDDLRAVYYFLRGQLVRIVMIYIDKLRNVPIY